MWTTITWGLLSGILYLTLAIFLLALLFSVATLIGMGLEFGSFLAGKFRDWRACRRTSSRWRS
jgi:hypothetical protein